ncbi:MAG TPA: c-type cytochrome, partial [Steroidobacteraceae bacterium]|nr:c-type cytochrome [Steroidobacteraceae bacterium]
MARSVSVIAQTIDDAYLRSCAACHGAELRGGETGPPLIGSAFQRHWAALDPRELEQFIRRTMPPTNPGSLSPADYSAAIAHIRQANGWPTGAAAADAVTLGAGLGRTEWLHNRGDLASTSYSPLEQINRDNVSKLRIAWRWKSQNFGPTPEFYFRATPLMAD